MLTVAAATTAGSTDENNISLAKTGATKCDENESNDVMNATVMNDVPAVKNIGSTYGPNLEA